MYGFGVFDQFFNLLRAHMQCISFHTLNMSINFNLNLLRSKRNKQALEKTQGFFECDAKAQIAEIFKHEEYNDKETLVAPTLFGELTLEPWLTTQCATLGGKYLFPKLVARPTHDVSLLESRQQAAKQLNLAIIRPLLQKIKDLEPHVLWIFGLPPLNKEAWPFRMLFPTWPVFSTMNHVPVLLACYHIFRTYLAPWGNLLYPLTTIFGPYAYVKRALKWPLTFVAYVRMLKIAVRYMLRPAETPMATIMRYATFVAYIGMFLYGVLQSFDLAAMMRDAIRRLDQKVTAVREFVATFQELQKECHWTPNQWTAFAPASARDSVVPEIPSGMSGMYALWTNRELRDRIQSILKNVYTVDMACATKKLQTTPGWCVPTYGEHTAMLSMGHPLLPGSQVRNPFALNKNIIITGPNAAGKTTYMKSICCNQILAQTVGVVCARRAVVSLVHAIGSFIRVADTVGKDSLFEAEAKRCSEMLEEATAIAARHQKALYFLDEPMHSTPPIEGAATAMAVVRHLAAMEGIRVFVTTHYHTMIELETEDPSRFINVCMEAIPTHDPSFHFPYRLRKGSSRQCIAIDLLQAKGFPDAFIESAIRYKNKICRAEIDTHHDVS